MNAEIIYENSFYEDTNHDRYFVQFRKGGETYNMGDCALIQAEEMTLNPNRELIEEDFRREDSAIIFAYFERVKTSPNKIIELNRNLEENGMLDCKICSHTLGVVMCDGIEVSKDMVLIHSPPLHICEIQCIWLQRNDLYVECKRYYRPEETHDGFKPALHGKQEVFDSRNFDIYKVEAIVGKASVQPRDEYMRRKDFPANSFFFYGFYDWFTQKVSGPVEVTKDSEKWCFRRKNISRYLEKSTPTQHSQLKDLAIKDKELPREREPVTPSKFPTLSLEKSSLPPTTARSQSQPTQKTHVRASLAIEIPSTPKKSERDKTEEESERKSLMVKVSVMVHTPQEDDGELLQVAVVDNKKTVERPKELGFSEKLLESSGSQVKDIGNVSIFSDMDGCDFRAMDDGDLFADNFQLNASTDSYLKDDVCGDILSEKESELSEEIEVITKATAAKVDSPAKVVETVKQPATAVPTKPTTDIPEERMPTRENIFLLRDSQLLEELEDENRDDAPAKQKKRLKKKGARNSDAFIQRVKDKRRKSTGKDGSHSSSSSHSESDARDHDENELKSNKRKLDSQSTDSDMDGSSSQDFRQCYCGLHYKDTTMLQCRMCAQWIHSICLGLKEEDARKMKRKHRYVCAKCLDDEENDRRPKKGKGKMRDELLAPTAGAQSVRISPRKVVSKTAKAKQYLEDPPTIYNLDLGQDEKAKRDKLRISSVNSESQAIRLDVAADDDKFDWSDRSELGKSPVKPALAVQERRADGDRMPFVANRLYSEMMKRDKPAQPQGPPESELTRKLREKARNDRAYAVIEKIDLFKIMSKY